MRRGADRIYPVQRRGCGGGVPKRPSTGSPWRRSTSATPWPARRCPSVAVITPQASSPRRGRGGQGPWVTTLGGAGREPVTPAQRDPSDPARVVAHRRPAVEARKLTLLDVANLFNLDGYWLGSPGGGHDVQHRGTAVPCRSSAPAWSRCWPTSRTCGPTRWLPRGTTARLTASSRCATTCPPPPASPSVLVSAGIMSPADAAAYLGITATVASGTLPPTPSTGGPDTGAPPITGGTEP